MTAEAKPEVTALTAKVSVITIGSRTFTQAIWDQLDEVEFPDLTPWGRVRPRVKGADHYITTFLVGTNAAGVLAKSQWTLDVRNREGYARTREQHAQLRASLPLILLGAK